MVELAFQTSDPQADFLELNSRYVAFVGGVGCGKTWAGALWCLLRAMEQPGMTGLIGSRTYPMLRDVIIPVIQEVIPKDLVKDWNKNEAIMVLANGAKLLFRSLEGELQVDRIRGLTVNWAWLDEASYIPPYAFKVLRARMRQGTGQRMALTTTPKGFDWVWEHFGKEGHPERYQAILGVASDTNPFVSPEYYEDLRSSYSGDFLKQEFYGAFVKFSGLVYPEFSVQDVLSRRDVDELVSGPGIVWRYGYDAGFTNPRVLLQVAQLPDGRQVLTREFYQRRALLSSTIPVIKEMQAGRPGPILADPSAKGEIEEMRAEGLDVMAASNEVQGGIQHIKSLLANGRLLVSEECQMTINELNSYHWDEERDKPVKEMDHAMDALRYCLGKRGSGPKRPGLLRRAV